GHVGPFHDVGLSVLALVPYAVGGWRMVLVALAALAALTVREVFLSARRLGVAPIPAALAAAAIGCSPPFVVYATQVYPEIPAAPATLFALRTMTARAAERGAPLAAGLAIAVLPWLHLRFWALIAPLVLVAWLAWPVRRIAGAVLTPLVVSTATYVFLIYIVYGHAPLSPMLLNPDPALRGWPTMGLGRIIVAQARPWLDPYDGLLLLSPIAVYALAAMPSLVRERGLVGRGLVFTAASYSALIGLQYLRSSPGDSP